MIIPELRMYGGYDIRYPRRAEQSRAPTEQRLPFSVYVGRKLPPTVSPLVLRAYFGKFGRVRSVEQKVHFFEDL